MNEVSPAAERPCANPACSETTAPGSAFFPYCSSPCRSRAAELAEAEVSVTAAREGQRVNQPCQGGGFVLRRLEVDSLVVKSGATIVVIPVPAVERALAKIGYRPGPKTTNGHAR
jgi:hypothetical protein